MRGRSYKYRRKGGTLGLTNDYGEDMQPGDIVHSARSSAPTGYLIANGAAVSRTTYANLYAAIGTTYGAGDGVNTFNLPDLRGEFVRGADQGRGVDAGRNTGTWQADDYKSHNHVSNTGNQFFAGTGGTGITTGGYWAGANTFNPNTGSSGGTETRPRNVALLPLIKY